MTTNMTVRDRQEISRISCMYNPPTESYVGGIEELRWKRSTTKKRANPTRG